MFFFAMGRAGTRRCPSCWHIPTLGKPEMGEFELKASHGAKRGPYRPFPG